MDDEEIPATAFDLDHRTCLVLLATERMGRLVLDQPNLGVIPVRFALTGERLVLVCLDGAAEAAEAGHHVVLEVDGIEERRQSGWSVMVRGRLAASDQPGHLDLVILELTGRWVSARRPLPALDGPAHLS